MVRTEALQHPETVMMRVLGTTGFALGLLLTISVFAI